MRVVADENIPFVREAFGRWGEVETVPGHAITAALVRDADVLLVRSITPVDESLLTGSRVQLVGSATSGTDHVDFQYLVSKGIGFCDAPGSNADAVAQYVVVALHEVASRLGRFVENMSIGIVGVGQVGSRLSRLCEALGMWVVWNDPPLAKESEDPRYQALEAALECDVVSLHVPLIHGGPYRTRGMVNQSFLDAMRAGSILINTCRGAVVDDAALIRAFDSGKIGASVLDVWCNEPRINPQLVERVTLGTPHVAGYSVEAKLRGTQMIHDGMVSMTGVESDWYYGHHLPPAPPAVVLASPVDWPRLFRSVYDIARDAAALRNAMATDDGSGFHALRKNYPPRREFSSITVQTDDPDERERLEALGFRLKSAPA